MKRKILFIALSCAILSAFGQGMTAFATPYNDSSVSGSAEWSAWTEEWKTVSKDFTKVSITPGADETQLNFAWYSKAGEDTPIVRFGEGKDALKEFKGISGKVETELTGGENYTYNHVTVTDLKENTTYYYTVEKNGVQTDLKTYKTGSFKNLKILYVGDPQIGASKGQPQGDGKLAVGAGENNTAARNDSFAWNRTLVAATEQNPDLNFMISAGDQVNNTGNAKEEEYAGYLNPEALSSLAVATTIGNHDSLNPDYKYHFYNPNNTENGLTQAGGDYYYSYGDGLFIVLNTNNYNAAEHENTIKEAMEKYADAKWKIVTFHQDIYGSGLDHSDTDGMILRTQLTPIIDKYDIDVVLQGHDHTYSRSKLLYGDRQQHGGYEFKLDETGLDYDWDNAYNINTNEQIPLYPEAGNTEGAAKRDAFQQDNKCYTIESTEGDTVTDPAGTLYISANSASGSKFYELIASQQDYIAKRSQNWLPSYSVIDLSDDTFAITTYQITEDNKVEKIDDTFTIKKTGAVPSTETAITRAEAVKRLYKAAGSPTVAQKAVFNDVSANADYADALAWSQTHGIILGDGQGNFKPDDSITRAQLSSMICRLALNIDEQDSYFEKLTDKDSVPEWADMYMRFAYNTRLMTGNTASPSEKATSFDIDYALTKAGQQ